MKAHPGIGLVYDGNKTIYYTDLKQVWKLNIETGEKEVVVKDVHTHELYLDKEGSLYGEHYWYLESEVKFKNYIWKMNPDGVLNKIREDQYGENEDFGFVRDSNFVSYELINLGSYYKIVKKKGESVDDIGQIKLNSPTWKYLSKTEDFYFVDYPSIYQVKDEKIIKLVENISKSRLPFSIQSEKHKIYGIWTDSKDNVYVAIYGGRMVRKINKNGEVSNMEKSSFFWSPVNGIFDNKGNLWLMESKLNGKIRVRMIKGQVLGSSVSFTLENILLIFGGMLSGLILFRLIKKLRPTMAIRPCQRS